MVYFWLHVWPWLFMGGWGVFILGCLVLPLKRHGPRK